MDIIEEKLKKIHKNYELLQKSEKWSAELPEQLLALKYIKENDKVLELGGHIGRNSIVISTILNNPKNLVTLEPNHEFYRELEKNIVHNNININIINGAISNRELWFKGLNTYTHNIIDSRKVNTYTFSNIQDKYKIIFDVLVIDCEGAFYYMLYDDSTILTNIKLIIIENDFGYKKHHKQFCDEKFKEYNFKRIYHESGGWGACEDNFYEVWSKK